MDQLKTVLPYFRPYRRAMFWGLVLVILANGFALANPYLLKLPIDALTADTGADPDATRRTVLNFALLIVAAAILGNAARYGMREILNGLSRRIEVDLRNDFLRHLLRLDAGFYGGTRTGDLMSLATNDTLAVRQAIGPAVMYTANTVVSFVVGLAVMIWISPMLTLVALVPMTILPPVVAWFGKTIHIRFERIQEQFAALSTMVQENLTGVRIVRAYGQEAAQAGEFDAFNRDYLKRNMHLAYASGAFHPIMGLLTGAAMVVVLWYGGGQVMAGRITTGDFVAFSFYLALLAWPMIALGWVVNLFQRGAASMGRINRIFAIEPAVAAPPAPRPTPDGASAIEFRDVSFRYPGTERFVLVDISFTAEPGRTVAIVGPTGSGKSTLVSLIARVYDPTSGTVLLDSAPLPDYDPADIRAMIGFAPQDSFLFSDRLGRNIGLGISAVPGRTHPRPAYPGRRHRRPPARHRRGLPGRIPHAPRGARHQPVRRAEAARHSRPGPGHRPLGPGPRRRAERGRHGHRIAHPERSAHRVEGPHRIHHLPPGHRREGRGPDPGPGRRAHCGAGTPRTAGGAGRDLRDAAQEAAAGAGSGGRGLMAGGGNAPGGDLTTRRRGCHPKYSGHPNQSGSFPAFHLMLQPTLGSCSAGGASPASTASMAARRSAPVTGTSSDGRLPSYCPR